MWTLFNNIVAIFPQRLAECKPKPTVDCKDCSYMCACVFLSIYYKILLK